MNELDLFSQNSKQNAPLPDRMRPRELSDVVGQEHLVGEGKALTLLQANVPNLILWGPPGCGKTTIAKLLAGKENFEQISAVLSGVTDLRKIIQRLQGRKTILFVDEIHRWNKSQQDALLPYMEDGTITLIGATTENPSFSLISPLLSRAKLFVLRALSENSIRALLERALFDKERGLGKEANSIDEEALDEIVNVSNGDARKALYTLEIAASTREHISLNLLQKLFEKNAIDYDKNGEQHYDTISAFIKSMRGSDPDAAIYYLAKMYEAGEDPKYIARRMIIFAAEDIGNADPRALQIAVNAAEAFERVGLAEGWIPLSQAVVYLATAPKSNASYMAYRLAKECLDKTGDLPVPLKLRNAATKPMKELGYGKNYEYAHNHKDAVVQHSHLPEAIDSEIFYQATQRGYEKTIKERMDWLKQQK